MDNQHDGGTLFLRDHSKDEGCIYIESPKDGIATVFTGIGCENAEGNARRLVACWNALMGFSTEKIENFVKENINSLEIAGLINDPGETQ